MFKKLVNLLFEEEEIEDFESEYDDEPVIEVRPKKVIEEVQAPKATVELPKQAEPVTLKTEKPQEVEVKVEEKPVVNEPKSIMINLEPVKETKVNVPKFNPKRETEYEFSQVISPIYGILDDVKKSVNDLSTNTQPKRKVVPNSSLLGTVISPIYGVTKDTKTTTPLSSRLMKEEDVENVSLDDLLSKPLPKNENDWFGFERQKREDDPNDLDSLIRSLQENELEPSTKHKMVESQLNLFGEEE